MSQADRGKGREASGDPLVAAREPVSVPGWLPWLLYALATGFLFRAFVVSDLMLLGTDTLSLGYVARDFFDRALERGVFPLWNPLILGGTPFLESLAGGDSLYPPSLGLLFVTETYRALGWKLVLHVFLAGIFMYGWLRVLDRSRGAALLGGLAYLAAPFLVTLVYPGHDGKIFVTALTPLLFWVTEWGFRGRGLLPWTAVAGVVGLVILTTHFQMAYFLFGAVGAYALFRTAQIWRRPEPVQAGRPPEAGPGAGRAGSEGGRAGSEPGSPSPARRALSRFVLFLAAALLGASLAGVQLLPSLEYVLDWSRRTATTVQADAAGSVAYSSSWSLHPEEILSLVVPEFVGGNAGGAAWTSDTYWGRNPFKLNHEYAGLVVLLLAGLSFVGFRRLRPDRRGRLWFLGGLGVVSLLYALGAHTPVWRIFYEVIPGVGLFRAPSMAIFLFGFATATLAAFGVDRGLEEGRSEDGRRSAGRLLWGATAALGLGTLMAASGALDSLWTGVFWSDIPEGRARILETAAPYATRGFFVATLLAAATAGLWWAFGSRRTGALPLLAGLGALLFVDAARVDDPFIQTFDFHRWAAPDGNMAYLQAQQRPGDPFRVLSMEQGGQDVRPALYGLELAAGHHPNDLALYRELIGMQGSGAPENLLRSQQLMAVLNVRYLVWPEARFGPLEGMSRVSSVQDARGNAVSSVYELPALPRARLVGQARIVPESETVATVLSPDFDAASEVVLTAEPPVELPGGPVAGEVRWIERTVNRHELSVTTPEAALLVIADNWFPAWEARVDGAEAPVLRANHALRAIPVPAGEHVVEMRYASGLLAAGAWLSLGTLLLLAGVAGASFYRSRRGRR